MKFIEHGGVRMLLANYSRIAEPGALRRVILETHRAMRVEPPRSLLLLSALDGVPYTMQNVQLLRDAVVASRPYVRARAVYGLPPIAMLSFRAVAALAAQGTMRSFPDGAAAREWLANV